MFFTVMWFVIWVTTLGLLMGGYQRFHEVFCLYRQGVNMKT